ncbi:MAG: HAD family phosphatase [Lachnospiraceae bacterium]|nr:HAD family phosphatase [Lachnospiraceae bacterium]
MKKGALFDMDGLLFDTEKVYQETWNEKAAEIGVSLDPEFKYQICGTSGDAAFQVVEKFYGVDDGRALAEEVYRRVAAKMAVSITEKPGMREILNLFKENGVKMAVASSTEIHAVHSNLQMTGIEPYFDAVISGKELEHGKPAPDIFLLAAEAIGVAPEDCYVFEDSISGIIAGHAAHMCPIMIPDLLQPTEEVKPYCAVYASLSDAAEAIRKGEI